MYVLTEDPLCATIRLLASDMVVNFNMSSFFYSCSVFNLSNCRLVYYSVFSIILCLYFLIRLYAISYCTKNCNHYSLINNINIVLVSTNFLLRICLPQISRNVLKHPTHVTTMLLVLSYKDPSTALVTEVSLETEHTVKVGNSNFSEESD